MPAVAMKHLAEHGLHSVFSILCYHKHVAPSRGRSARYHYQPPVSPQPQISATGIRLHTYHYTEDLLKLEAAAFMVGNLAPPQPRQVNSFLSPHAWEPFLAFTRTRCSQRSFALGPGQDFRLGLTRLRS